MNTHAWSRLRVVVPLFLLPEVLRRLAASALVVHQSGGYGGGSDGNLQHSSTRFTYTRVSGMLLVPAVYLGFLESNRVFD